jgi:hypothetical protein
VEENGVDTREPFIRKMKMSVSLYVRELIVNDVNSFVVSLAGSYAL